MSKVLFFIVGTLPTADELALIANITGNVQLRSNTANATFGGNLEPADGLAGTIPAAYKTASGGTAVDTALYPRGDVTPNNVAGIDKFVVIPAAPAVTGTASIQMRAMKIEEDPTTGAVTVTEVTANCAWVSATPAKATITTPAGLATGVAAGTSVLTATYDYDGAGSHAPLTASATITVS